MSRWRRGSKGERSQGEQKHGGHGEPEHGEPKQNKQPHDAQERPVAAGPVVRVDPGDLLGSVDNARLVYLQTRDPQYLNLALDLAQLALDTAPPGEAGRGTRAHAQHLRGLLLRMRFEAARDPADLAAAVAAGRTAVATVGDGEPVPAPYLSGLGNSLQEVSELNGDVLPLEEATGLYRQALAGLPHQHPLFGGLQSNLGNALLRWARITDLPEPAAEAVLAARAALRATPANDAERASWLYNLGAALMQHAHHTESVAILEEAALAYRGALNVLPPQHPASRSGRVILDQLEKWLSAAPEADGPRPAGDPL